LPESELLSVFEGVPQREVSRSDLAQGMGIIDMLAGGETPFLSSGGDARRALKENSVSVNRNKVGPDHTLTTQDAIGSGIILIQRGKKNHYLVRITG
jgi:tyrosyl-tRNA synthetase